MTFSFFSVKCNFCKKGARLFVGIFFCFGLLSLNSQMQKNNQWKKGRTVASLVLIFIMVDIVPLNHFTFFSSHRISEKGNRALCFSSAIFVYWLNGVRMDSSEKPFKLLLWMQYVLICCALFACWNVRHQTRFGNSPLLLLIFPFIKIRIDEYLEKDSSIFFTRRHLAASFVTCGAWTACVIISHWIDLRDISSPS